MSKLSENTLDQALNLLGTLLEEAGVTYSLVVAGGSALLAQKITSRNAHDVDVIALDGGDTRAHPLPQTLTDAATRWPGAETRIQLAQRFHVPVHRP